MAKKTFMSTTPDAGAGRGSAASYSDLLINNAGAGRGSAASYEQLIINNPGAGRGTVNPGMPLPDSYRHETNNIVATPEATLNIQFQPNILDNFDVVTYHWKLFIVPPAVAKSGIVTNLQDQTIIAESGVTDLTIDKVELRAITTPSVEGGTGVTTNFKFEVTEPSGAGMLDQLFYQSIALGIGNWHVMPVYLELQFRGRDPITSEANAGMQGTIGDLRWIWPVKLGDIKANVTNVGTRYDFTATLYNELTQSNAHFSLQSLTSLRELNKFGDAMQQLEDALNADQMLKLINTYSIPDVYKIVVDPKIANYAITPVNSNTNSVRNNDYVKFNEKSATFNVGTSVDKIIDALLANTNEYQTGATDSATPGGICRPMDAEVSQMKKFWRIITETRPIDFDVRRQDNVKEFTIFIVDYDIGVLAADASQTSAPPHTIEASKKRLATYAKKSILKKKYNYIFTGLNDQVINFDLNLNAAFGAIQSRMGGIYSNQSMSDKGVVYQDRAVEEASVTEKLNKAISLQNNSATAKSPEASAAMKDAAASVAASKLDDATKAKYIKLLENSKPENRLNYLNTVRANGGIGPDGELSRVRQDATNLAKPISDFAGRFLSDVNINGADSKAAFQSFLNATRGKLRPTAFYEGIQDKAVGLGVEANSNSGMQKMSSVFSVAMHSGLDASLQKIKLTIKGDPFWLFPQPYTGSAYQIYNSLKPRDEAIAEIKNGHFRKADSVNIYGTDNFIIIRFRTPRIPSADAADSPNDYNEVETFSGVYKVVVVTSRFENGKFLHDLECILDPEIRLLDFMNDIEEDATMADIPTTAADLTKKSTFPETAIRTPQRILGSNTIDVPPVLTAGGGIPGPASNIPSVSPSILAGLPPTFG